MGILSSIFKRKPRFSEFPDTSLKVDLHSHLLTAIDDGCTDFAMSEACIIALQNQGIKHIITTPHIISGLYPNTPAVIKEKLNALKAHLTSAGIQIQIEAAAEHYIDEWFVEELKKGSDFLTFSNKHILVETNYVEKPPYLEETIFNLNMEGYKVVFAHPERYHYLLKDFRLFEKLRDTGIRFQLNLMSLTGHYGPQIKKAAEFLIENQMVDLVGSDIHKPEHAHLIGRLKRSEAYSQLKEAINRTNNLVMS